jgi:hypothetical protein
MSMPWVVDVTIDGGEARVLEAYDGTALRSTTNADDFIANGWDAGTGSRTATTVPIYIAIIEPFGEPAGLNTLPAHVGYKDSASGSSRVVRRLLCTNTDCTALNSLSDNPSHATHANHVTSTALGSIEQAQDPNVTSSSERLRRSGFAKEAEVILLSLNSSSTGDTLARALESAINEGVDVINMSLGMVDPSGLVVPCDPSFNPAGTNTLIQTATAFGILIVAASGNSSSTQCTVAHPAIRSEVVSVGGLETDQFGAGVPAYGSTIMQSTSSRGSVPIAVNGNTSRRTAGIGLSAAGVRKLAFERTNQYSGNISGTSFAAPAVAGAAALWRDFFVDQNLTNGFGVQPASARMLKVNLLAMADGYDGNSAGAESNTGMSSRSGAGRLSLDFPGSPRQTSAGSVFAWQMGQVTISSTTTTTIIPIPPGARWLKAAIMWTESGNYSNSADITFALRDVCGTGADLFVYDSTFSFEKRLRSSVLGKTCPRLEIQAYHLPTARTVYYAWYTHSGISP